MQPSDKSTGIGIKFQCILQCDGRGGVCGRYVRGGHRDRWGHEREREKETLQDEGTTFQDEGITGHCKMKVVQDIAR
jgi:hypothetical protein